MLVHSSCIYTFYCSGYSIEGDLDLLIRSWSFAADILCSPLRVVDIKTLAAMVCSLLEVLENSNICSCIFLIQTVFSLYFSSFYYVGWKLADS